ncbi:MAG: glycosyltransferase family 2 protein [Candidatus Wildermuthbacteria bacterium]|nr:glycosyltransferase family 2 protein [Candidatus Wildermuthbacteria bacterium]
MFNTFISTASHTLSRATSLGAWFLFFVVIYLILLVKVVTLGTFTFNLFFGFYSTLVTVYILSRFFLAYFHKPIPANTGYQPTVTFIVPSKNEERNIAHTIRCFSRVNYPKEKIEVIAVNDGSTDNTLGEMLRIKREISKILPVRIVNWQKNRGKRAGMAEGIRLAKSEIVIFVDSDSFVDKNCVTHLVKYFVNPEVGAVSGHSNVYNRDINLLTRMQDVRYYISFKIYKGAESVFGNVMCCPGSCSAYKKEYLLEFLDDWLNQKFLGSPCTFGDDRSLTNHIVKKYKAVYSPEALAWTVVPENFSKYLRQQQRWKKSWLRETFIAATFMWKKNPLAAISFYSYLFIALLSPLVFVRAVFWYPLTTHQWPVIYLAGLFLMLLLHGFYYRANAGGKGWLLAIVDFWFTAIILMWQLPWALLTIRDSRWGTR